MIYNYFCEDKECTFQDLRDSSADDLVVKLSHTNSVGEQLLVWEVSHGMMEDPAIECPVCGGKAVKHLAFNAGNFVFLGNCYLDKTGCKTQMDLHYLDGKDDNGDPLNTYEEYYESGEKDHIRATLKRGGKKAPMISTGEAKRQISQAKLDYIQSVVDFIGKPKVEVEVHW